MLIYPRTKVSALCAVTGDGKGHLGNRNSSLSLKTTGKKGNTKETLTEKISEH